MADLLGTDEFLVNRNDVTYTQQQETLMATLQDTDHLLINRAGQTYKITGSDLINSVVDPLEVTVVLAPLDGYTDTEVTAVPVVSGGKQPDGGFVFTYQWVTADSPDGTNKTNIAGANNATFTPDNAQVGLFLGCVVSTTDALGTTAEGEAYIGPIQVLAQAPVIADVVVSEIYDGVNRFTDKEFPYVTTMVIDGEPDPTFEVKAKLSGTTFDFDVLSDVITDVESGGIKTCETDTIESVEDYSGWNQSQVWSSNCSPTTSIYGNVVNAFDGDLATKASTTDSSGYLYTNPSPEDTIVQTLEVYAQKYAADSVFKVNGVSYIDEVGSSAGWHTISFPIGQQLQSINWGANGSGLELHLFAVKVNDQILVDTGIANPPSIGSVLTFPSSNGFDCFEPGDVVQSDWDQSAVWSNRVTCADGFAAGKGVTFGFDGDTSTECEMSATAFANQSPIVYTGTHSNVTSFSLTFAGKLYFNGSSDQAVDPDGNLTQNNGYYPIASVAAPSTITSIEIYPYGTAHAGGVRTIEINGKTIVDQGIPGAPGEAKVISKDDSDPYTITVDGGNWTDGNSNITGDFVTGQSAQGEPDITDGKGFDGNNTTAIRPTNADLEFYWDWPQGVKVNSTIRVHSNGGDDEGVGSGMVAGTMPITINKGRPDEATLVLNSTVAGINDVDPTPYVDFSFTGTLYSVYITPSSENTGNPKNYAHLSAIIVDGRYLVQGPDADDKLVKETPYAAKLTVASSENLELLTGDVFMTDGSDTPATQTPYKLVTTDFESAEDNAPTTVEARFIPRTTFTSQPIQDANWSTMTVRSSGDLTLNTDFNENGDVFAVYSPVPFFATAGRVSRPGFDVPMALAASNDGVTWTVVDSGQSPVYTNKATQLKSPEAYKYFATYRIDLNSPEIVSVDMDAPYSFGSPATAITLTFPGDVSTNPDLQYFKPGDVLQEAPPVNASISGYDQTYNDSIGREITMNNGDEYDITSNQTYWWTKEDVGNNSFVFKKVSGQNFQIYGYTAAETNVDGGATRLLNDVTEFTLDASLFASTYEYIRVYATSTGVMRFAYDSDVEEVKVISTGYPDSNTITVDGGDWTGADGSGFGDGRYLPDQEWSDGITTNGTINDTSKGFDGNLNSKMQTSSSSSYIEIDLGDQLEGVLETYKCSGSKATLNGVASVGTPLSGWWAIGTCVKGVTSVVRSFDNSSYGGEINALRVDGKVLVNASIPGGSGDTHVEYQTNGGQGSIIEVNTTDNTLLVTNSGDGDNRWIAENYGEGSGTSTDFYVAPADAVPISQDYAWGKLQIINNKAQVTGIQKDDPGFLPVPAKDYSIKFPAVFPTGNEPDADLPSGTCVAAIVAAENSQGRSVKESNCFMPIDVNPDGAAGPITGSTPTTLTVASNANLSDFSPGDNLVMVNEDNEISSYTMQTSTIESVGSEYSGSADVQPSIAGSWEQVLDGVACNIAADCGMDTSVQTTWTFDNAITVTAEDTFEIFNSGGSNYSNIVGWSYDNDADNFTYVSGNAGIHGGGWDWDTLAVVGNLKKLRVGASLGFSITAYRLNGKILDLGNQTLTFPGDVSTNPDLRYFKSGDVVQGAELGQKYNLYGTDLNETTLVDPSSISGWSENSLGSSNLTGNANILYADFGGSISPVFTRIDGGTGSDYTHQNLCYWNGTDWIVNATVSGGLSASNQLIATKSARYWAAFRNDSSLAIGSTVSSFSKANAGSHWSADVFGFSAPDDGAVKVISTGYPNSNTMVVDGGEWSDGTSDPGTDQSRIWSNGGSGVFNQPVQNMFDGQTGDGSTFASFNDALVTFDPPVPFTELQVNGYLNSGMGANPTCLINGIDVTSQISQQNPGESTDNGHANIITGVGSALSSFKCTTANNYGNPISAIVIDGLILKDPAGDTKATYGPVTGTGTFQSADLAANTITMSVSNDRWIDNTNRLGIDFYCRDNITVLNADNPKHVAMQQAIAAAFDAFPEKVNERRTSIASSFYRLMEGETLSAADYTLLEETVLDAVNAQEPFALNGFYPLYYTSAKADSASSTDSHHSHTIAGVTYYMPDGGTLYHGNYIAPETATTDTNDSSSSSSHNYGSGSSY